MNKIVHISINDFKEKFNVKNTDPYTVGFITENDINKVKTDFGIVDAKKKLVSIIMLLPLLPKELSRIVRNFPQIISSHLKRVKSFYSPKNNTLTDLYPFSDYALKGNIIAAFYPKTLLEIGTSRGFGTTTFMSLLKNSKCFTLNPKNNESANNPIDNKEIGEVFKNKKLDIKLLYKDSQTFDYTLLPAIDACYIDGNHEYSYVYSDLKNCATITKKIVMLDDYIPTAQSERGDVFGWGWWNADVVRAVSTFITKYPKVFKEGYWLKGTPICVLIK